MISIVVPAYNSALVMGPCVASIKAQTVTDWECIIVDDGSKDSTYDTALWLTQGDDRFRVIKQRNRGCGGARNGGLELASGDAVTFIDADDWIDPDYLETLTKYMRAYAGVGRIVGLEMQHWPQYNNMSNLWAISPAGFLPASDPRIFANPNCDLGHATAVLYVKKNLPGPIVFPRVKMLEDLVYNIGLTFAGVDSYVLNRAVYHYVRRTGSLITTTITSAEAGMIRGAFDYQAAIYSPSEELYARCKKFLENALKGRIKD